MLLLCKLLYFNIFISWKKHCDIVIILNACDRLTLWHNNIVILCQYSILIYRTMDTQLSLSACFISSVRWCDLQLHELDRISEVWTVDSIGPCTCTERKERQVGVWPEYWGCLLFILHWPEYLWCREKRDKSDLQSMTGISVVCLCSNCSSRNICGVEWHGGGRQDAVREYFSINSHQLRWVAGFQGRKLTWRKLSIGFDWSSILT